MTIKGLHHITAIASEPQGNLDFYTAVLGLRLVKRTVNYDDPGTYHFYFGDAAGVPGTLVTFFPWRGTQRGRTGTGQVNVVAFSIPEESIDFWMQRLRRSRINFEEPPTRFGEKYLALRDADGLALELIASPETKRPSWSRGSVPVEHAIRGIHHVAAAEEGHERSARLLIDVMGLKLVQESGNRFRFGGSSAGYIDLLCMPGAPRGSMGAGIVHHVAWRAEDDVQQRSWREKLVELGYNVSPVMDRQYFHSIYFREPGGVLFEIATDGPGFAIDEGPDDLGRELKLPPWLEQSRQRIERDLPPVHLPVER